LGYPWTPQRFSAPTHLDLRGPDQVRQLHRTLNAWLGERCRALWDEVRHPEHTQFSVAEMLEHERAHLMPMPVPFDGYVEKPARVSSTCLVSVARLPLFSAVRTGGAEGQHAAVPGQRCHHGG
jgi:hypothetical protein